MTSERKRPRGRVTLAATLLVALVALGPAACAKKRPPAATGKPGPTPVATSAPIPALPTPPGNELTRTGKTDAKGRRLGERPLQERPKPQGRSQKMQ